MECNDCDQRDDCQELFEDRADMTLEETIDLLCHTIALVGFEQRSYYKSMLEKLKEVTENLIKLNVESKIKPIKPPSN